MNSNQLLPILVYHSVGSVNKLQVSPWHLSSDIFEKHLYHLREQGFYSITLENWRKAIINRQTLPGKPILITFDDGYYNFYSDAYPLLKKYGFSAIVFLIAGAIGMNEPNSHLMGWQEIKELQAEGIEFGSHSLTHPYLTQLSYADAKKELENSWDILSTKLEVPVMAFAYPHNDSNPAIEKLTEECGYTCGLSITNSRSSWEDSFFHMSRIEILNNDTLPRFILRLHRKTK